jgi:hypothetical protein
MEAQACNLKARCSNGSGNDKFTKCNICSNYIHVGCSSKILAAFQSNAKNKKESDVTFLETDAVCGKRCYNKIIKARTAKPPPRLKVSRFWNNDGTTPFVNSMSVLMDWITTEGNYSRWRGGDKQSGATKKTLPSLIAEKIQEEAGTERTGKDVQNKIVSIESQYRCAADWLANTGQGVTDKTQLRTAVLERCPHYYDLYDIMEDRASTRPLFSAGGNFEEELGQELEVGMGELEHSDGDGEPTESEDSTLMVDKLRQSSDNEEDDDEEKSKEESKEGECLEPALAEVELAVETSDDEDIKKRATPINNRITTTINKRRSITDLSSSSGGGKKRK